VNAGYDIFDEDEFGGRLNGAAADPSDSILDIREYDVPYHVRFAIDRGIRVGKWYHVEAKHGSVTLKCLEERLTRADPVVMAFDIETCKAPLKFPDSSVDQIMMISYMIDAQGFLITNREIVSEDIADFDYTPRPEYDGPFIIFNEPDEKAVLERFFEHIKEAKPTVMVTYNGDFFDWPYIEARASILGIDMYQEIGFRKNSEDIYQSNYCAHMDAFAWVSRDSYLPQGSRGLKAVTVAKLGYDPDELDPELMTPYASEHPQTLAEYSVSDAVATYYLYMKYVHPFIFALCTIIPLGPDDVLRKGTGTLCEMLLMVEAVEKNILMPNKHQAPKEAFWEGHLLESETYVGGHVESIEAGVFRSDIPCNFALDPTAFDDLIRDLDAALTFSVVVEEKKSLDDITNYDEVKAQIAEKLLQLKNTPNRCEKPSIYHLDVASMYPNIMTTNRLQPDSMIQEKDCAACDFNRPGKTCDRRMPWSWRGEFLPAKRDEYNMVRNALEHERFPPRKVGGRVRTFQELPQEEQAALVKKRLTEYSKKIYHKIHETKTIEREAIICQRENPFYVDTVKMFRDRRYDYKGQQKVWKGKLEQRKADGGTPDEIDEAKKMIVLFDSLQLAHKVILNSFYGYVMRKGSRWYSMEMAGVTCLTGAKIIQMARTWIDRLGRPLELDTDGIWCILPGTFPENFAFKLKNGKKLAISYPCVMLNHLVHAQFTNHQYQELVDPKAFKYETHSDNTIFFEVDGPYRAMILPTSKEEDRNLKKRYAVFNHDGSLAELKGFEVKRRGELKLIKIFQTQIFKFFLDGTTLEECYGAVAKVSNRWLDVLDSKGSTLADEELIDLICENKSMAKSLEEYGSQKSTAITTAKRLAEFLGEQMVKDKGLNCKYIISSRPRNSPVTDRAIPVAIFSAEENVKRYFLRRWLKEDPGTMDVRDIIDWQYYLERLSSVIQKLITIPAALQKVANPVPRVAHPDWLARRIRTKEDKLQQVKMTDMFAKKQLAPADINTLGNRIPLSGDLEDFGATPGTQALSKRMNGMATKMVQKRKAPEPVVPVNTDPFAGLPSKMPPISEDYKGWLQYQKQKWKMQKQARIRRRQLFGDRRTDTSDAIGSYFRNQAEMVFIGTWQLVQLRETETPGEVRAFVLIDSKIHALKVVVPRILYFNLKTDDLPDVTIEGCEVEKVVGHTLPNGHPSVHLFKLTLPESIYRAESQKVRQMINHPSVEGVYEQNLPLHTRAVLQLGNICTIDETQRGVLGKGLDQGFDLSSLRQVPLKQPYLYDSPMRYLYLCHIVTPERQIFAIFSSTSSQAHFIVQNRARDEQGMPNIDKIYQDLYERNAQNGQNTKWQECFEYSSDVHFKITLATSRRKALTEVGDVLKKMRADDKDRATVLVVQSQQVKMLSHDVSVMRDFPILSLKPDDADKQLPPLGWQSAAAKRVIAHFLGVGSWISHLTELSRYGNIPICNLEAHDVRFLIDIAYARRLQKEKVILWWSAGPQPDHAGHEKDSILNQLEQVDMPSVNHPGTYSSVCIDITVRNLAVNTILASSLINEAEGANSISFNPAPQQDGENGEVNSTVLHSENAFANASIMVLRDMVKAWWAEASAGGDMADILVQHLLRWVEHQGSFLYDRSLHYYVQMMSKKALQQLMADFRRVGSNIVYASAHRLLLQTTKAEVGNAFAYSQYILKTVKEKPIFTFLDLEIQEYWDYLIWYDAFNYGGKGCKEVVEAEQQTLETIMNWQLSTFLPISMQQTFEDWVVEFVSLMHTRKRPQHGDGGRLTQIAFKSITEEQYDPDDENNKLPADYTKSLQKQVSALARRQQNEILHPELAGDYVFPDLPGSHLPLENPTLQLVKSIMQVLSLDRSLNISARQLRAQLLSIFDIREFSAAASFANPSASLVIQHLVCNECCAVRDLDLCRDADILPPAAAAAQLAAAGDADPSALVRAQSLLPAWRCQQCNSSLDRLAVEQTLVTRIQRDMVMWATQDLKCSKCSRVRANEFMEHCACAGEWVGAGITDAEVKGRLKVMDKVARWYGMGMLAEVVKEASG
jgi:DNA polymerase epsilon subunit 1